MGRLRGIGRSGTIGVDIDRGSIKAVQLQGSGAGYVLQHVGYHRLPPGAIIDGEVADQNLLAAELREFWDSHSFKGRSIVFGVSNQKVVVRLLDFPHMRPEDLQGAISFEAQDHIPMPLDEAVLDYVVLGPREERADLDRVLVVAAQREMISRYTSAVRAGGLRPEEKETREEGRRVQRETDDDPVVPEAVEARLDDEQHSADEREQRRRDEDPVRDPLDVLTKGREPRRIPGHLRTNPEELHHQPASHPDHRQRDVREQEERVPGHPSP